MNVPYLHLNWLTVDELTAGDDRLEDDSWLLAAVHDDVVALALEKSTFC